METITMDEVFANNSIDTVVVPPDFSVIIDNFTKEAHDLQELLNEQGLEVDDKSYLKQCDNTQQSISHHDNSNISYSTNIQISASFLSQPWIVSEETDISTNQSTLKPSDFEIKSSGNNPNSYITSICIDSNDKQNKEEIQNNALLRHTQSAVVNKAVPLQDIRPRAQSATLCNKYRELAATSAQYVNLIEAFNPEKTFKLNDLQRTDISCPKPFPTYMNVPFPSRGNALYSSERRQSNSAPNTPKGKSNKSNPSEVKVNGAYITLWGMKHIEDKESLSDSECEEIKKITSMVIPTDPMLRQSGYVEMTSPFIRSPKENVSNLATNVASYAGNAPRNIFCPFCPRYFGYEKSLSNHIQKSHYDELHKLAISPCDDTFYQFCPICKARFFNTSVLPRHLLECHKNFIIRILLKYDCIKCTNNCLQCPFCTKKVPNNSTGDQVLLYHMQHSHENKLEELMEKKFKPYFSGCKKYLFKQKPEESKTINSLNNQPTPGLSGKLCHMNVNNDSNPKQSEIVNSKTEPIHITEKVIINKQISNKGILRSDATVQRRPSAKRELRFSVPPVTCEEVYVPESPESNKINSSIENIVEFCDDDSIMPIRVDSLGSADFIELTDQSSRKRRRLGIGIKHKKVSKKKDKENIENKENINNDHYSNVKRNKENINFMNHVVSSIGKMKPQVPKIVTTSATKTFRRPKPVATPKVPTISLPLENPKHVPLKHRYNGETVKLPAEVTNLPKGSSIVALEDNDEIEGCPFSNMKLISPTSMFRCNSCRVTFCDNESLMCHISSKHRGFLGILRPQYGCGVCSAKFYENKYLVKHCLQHHTSLLEIRSPKRHKVTIYRFSQD